MAVVQPKIRGPEGDESLAGVSHQLFGAHSPPGSSLLTQPSDWTEVCREAASLSSEYAPAFFFYRFDWVQVGTGQAFATGYYIPETRGARTSAPDFAIPVYRTPPDLIRCTRADGTSGRGRIDPNGVCVPYFSRAEIEDGALAGKGLEIGWAADPVDLFFIEIQGSGELRIH